MGFFNDLREDLASAVNQLTDDKNENDIEISSQIKKDELTKKDKKNKRDKHNNVNLEQEIKEYLNVTEEIVSKENNDIKPDSEETEVNSMIADEISEEILNDNSDDNPAGTFDVEYSEKSIDTATETRDIFTVTEEIFTEEQMEKIQPDFDNNDYTVISNGTAIKGGIETTGSIEINGTVEGDVKANGELILSGTINGNVEALIISVNAGKIKGNVKAYNGIYISGNSVIIGDIESTEAEIGGAVKGKIDVNGPVVLKSQAKVLGDIDCKSVEINNGGVIEGKCSQKYADVSPSAFFENL